jgi:hypothetical protein
VKELPPLELLQSDPLHRQQWIEYSARDAVATWFVRDQLEQKLKDMPWEVNGKILGTMFDYYMKVRASDCAHHIRVHLPRQVHVRIRRAVDRYGAKWNQGQSFKLTSF